MSLTIDGRVIAEARIQGVTLRGMLGAFELMFGFYLSVKPKTQDPERLSITGARIRVSRQGEAWQELGYATPQWPFEVIAHQHQINMSPGLILSLQYSQINALEDLRDTGDLDFELLVFGKGFDANGEHTVQETLRTHVPKSVWIKQLKDAKARDVLMLEVPMSFVGSTKRDKEIHKNLRHAEECYRNGDYLGCVASCRTAVQELGYRKQKNKNWAGNALSALAGERNSMGKDAREIALFSALRHYTHLAHHSDSEGGVTSYTRAEARLILSMTASVLAYESYS